MIDKEYRKKAIALLMLITTKNTSRQEIETASHKLAELIKENNFPDLLFNLGRSERENTMSLIYKSTGSRIAHEMCEARKRARLKSEEFKSKPDSLVPVQCKISKGFERLKQVRIVTDRDFNLLYQNPEKGTKIGGDFNYRVKWIHDIFINRLTKFHRLGMLPFEIEANAFEESIKENTVAIISKEFASLRAIKGEKGLPIVSFTDSDFRRDTGLKHLSGEEIKSLVEKYGDLKVTGCIARYRDELREVNHNVHLIRASYVSIIYDTTEYISPRGKKPENEYMFLIDIGGFFVLQNLINGWVTVFPRHFYALKGGAQEIYRHIAQFPKTVKRSINTISKWLGYIENPKNITQRKKVIKGYLDELKRKKLLKFWKAKGRGRKTIYVMVQNKK